MPEPKKNFVWGILERKVFLMINLFILILLVVSFGREFLRDYQIDREITALREQAEELEARNLEIADLNAEFETEGFLEGEARLRLGLSKPGEQVVVIEEAGAEVLGAETATLTGVTPGSVPVEHEQYHNAARWYFYFFNQDKYQYLKFYEYR